MVIGAPASGLLLQMHGVLGKPGWFWMFLIEGLLAIAVGFAAWYCLDDSPRDARYFTTIEAETSPLSLLDIYDRYRIKNLALTAKLSSMPASRFNYRTNNERHSAEYCKPRGHNHMLIKPAKSRKHPIGASDFWCFHPNKLLAMNLTTPTVITRAENRGKCDEPRNPRAARPSNRRNRQSKRTADPARYPWA